MKTTIVMLAAMVLGPTCAAAASQTLPSEAVVLCADRTADLVGDVRAREVASKIFNNIGVRLEWHTAPACPRNSVRVQFSYKTAPSLQPGALAYAICGDTQIVVFYDRVIATVEPKIVAALLGHVLAHEITHILQGVARHSQDGLMKAHWTPNDYAQMGFKALTFTQDDITLIRFGFERLAHGTEPVPTAATGGN